jgi:glycosyltransferase involved in cell wall biosynthesis
MELSATLLTDSFLPSIGGKELVVHYLATYLNRLGCRATVVTGGFRSKSKSPIAYTIHRYIGGPACFPITRNLGWLLFERIRSDSNLIHAHRAYPAGYYAVLSKQILNIPVVITSHGDDVLTVRSAEYGLRLNPDLEKKVSYALQKADAVIALNEGMEKSIADLGVPSERIYRISNGVEIDRFNCENGKNTQEAEGSGIKIVLAVGFNRPVKGFDDLLKAMSIVVAKEPKTKCVIVGKGTENLSPLAHTLKIENNVELRGQISNFDRIGVSEELIRLYKKSYLYVSSSLSEAFSLTILEAMASGLSVVATDTIGSRALIQDGVEGFLTPVGNTQMLAEKIIKVLQNARLRQTLATNARLKASKYSWEIIARKHIELYEKLLMHR